MRGSVVALALLASFARAEAVSDSWPTFHGGYGLTGHSAAQFTAKPVRLWRFKAAGPVTTTPVAGAGRIYCLAGDCTVTALDLSGNKVWETKLGVERTEETTPPAPRPPPAWMSSAPSAPFRWPRRWII